MYSVYDVWSRDSGERLLNIDSGRYVDYQEPPNQHFTVIFNAFVMMRSFMMWSLMRDVELTWRHTMKSSCNLGLAVVYHAWRQGLYIAVDYFSSAWLSRGQSW